jgi:hypothetical protein
VLLVMSGGGFCSPQMGQFGCSMGLGQMDIRVHVTETTNPSKYTVTNAIKPSHSLYMYIFILS